MSSCCFSSAISISNLCICCLSCPDISTKVRSCSVTIRRHSIICLLVWSNEASLQWEWRSWDRDCQSVEEKFIFVKMIDVERQAERFPYLASHMSVCQMSTEFSKKLSIFCKVITFIKSVRAFCLFHLSRVSSASFLWSGLQSAPLFAYWDLRPESSDIFLFIWLANSELDSCTQSTSDGDRSKYKLHTCNLWSCSLLWSVRFLRVSSISLCICCIPSLMDSDDILNARHSLLFAWEHREINLLPLSSIPRTRCLKIVTCLQTSPLEITTNITQLRTSCRRSYLNTSVLLAEMSPRLFLFLPRNL